MSLVSMATNSFSIKHKLAHEVDCLAWLNTVALSEGPGML